MTRNALEPAARPQRAHRQARFCPVWLRTFGMALACGAGLAQPVWSQTGATHVLPFQRVPLGTAFEARFMPFQSASPLASYGALGSVPWVTLQYPGGKGAQAFLQLSTLSLFTSSPGDAAMKAAANAPRSTPPNQDRAQRAYTAEDVRALWTNRRVPTGWLDAEGASEAVRQTLKQSGRLPADARIQALAGETYAEMSTSAATPGKLVLKTLSGQTLVPQAPAPTWVEPLFHGVFIACVPSERPAAPPFSKDVLGNRYETGRRCGLMGPEGQWLASPEFEFIEATSGWGNHVGAGPFLLLLRGQEPCVSTLHLPVQVACLGQPLASLFVNGRLPFSKENPDSRRRGGSTLGYVSVNGTWAIPPAFLEAQAFTGKVATVRLAGVPGVIDGSGKWLTPAAPNDPVAARWLNQQGMHRLSGMGLINRSGEMVIPFLYPQVQRVSDTRYQVCHQDGCDTLPVPKAPKATLAPPIVASVARQTVHAAAGWVPAAENDRWGFQDASGQWVLKPQFEETEPFEGGLAKAKSKGLWGIILPSGKWLHAPAFQAISPFENGVAVAQHADKDQQALLHADGKRFDVPGRLSSLFADDGLAVASGAGGVGYTDRTGNWVIEPTYADAQPFAGGHAVVSGALPDGWRPPHFKEPPYYLLSVHRLSPDVLALRARVGKEERVGLVDKGGNWLVPAR